MAKTVEGLLETYNTMAKGLGVRELKSWKGDAEGLQKRIDALTEKAKNAKAKGKAAKAKAKGNGKADKAPRLTVKSIAYAGIDAGHDNERILADIAKKLPEANTKVASIRWYRSKKSQEANA